MLSARSAILCISVIKAYAAALMREHIGERGQEREHMKESARKTCLCYLGTAVFCAVFSRIYGHFSHEIRSPWMTWLFLWPLAGGYLPALLQAVGILPVFSGWRTDLYRFGIAAGSTASLLKGILEIAGTDSFYPDLLLYAGIAMLAAGAILYVAEAARLRRQRPTE